MRNFKYSVILPVVLFMCLLLSGACKRHYTPKPEGFIRIDLPEKKYLSFDSTCPFSFEYPAYAAVNPDHSRITEPCWLNIDFNRFHARIYLSYHNVGNDLAMLMEDSRTFAYKHTIKADAIEESLISFPERHVYGVLYDIKGNAASSIQFYLTDSTRHFIRAALYFNSQPNYDSLAPVVEFIREDVIHLAETLVWSK
jgi:gliding motility-associated lipoprotein GldD